MGILTLCLALMYFYPHAMLNPGDLMEAHKELNDKCLACHEPLKGISNDKCISCHKLSDIGKDSLMQRKGNAATEKVSFHEHLAGQKCTSCHTDHKGLNPPTSLSSFNHEMLPANILINCNSCHGQPSDNLHQQLKPVCNNCHQTTGWKSSVRFNHDMIQGDYRNNCASCHKSPGDSFHQQLKDNCDKCHSTEKWKPSTFDHNAYFLLDDNHNSTCTTCHPGNNFTAYTCYGCHEHSETKIREEHTEHGIFEFTNCASCHRSGDEHDIRMNNNNNKQQLDRNEIDNMKNYIKSQDKERKKKKKESKENDDD